MKNRALFTYLCYAVASLSLLCAYFAFGIEPAWMKDITWTKDRTILFLLEFGCLTAEILILSFSDILSNVTKDPMEDYFHNHFFGKFLKQRTSISVDVIFFILSSSAFPYALFKFSLGENLGIRLSYSLFAFFISFFWLCLARDLLTRPAIILLTTFKLIKSTPAAIFSYGRGLFPILNILAVSVSLSTLPFLFILPTLPISQSTFQVNQRAIAALVGILLCLTLLIAYLLVQVIISSALNQSLLNIDQEIELNLYTQFKPEASQTKLESLKVLIEVREALVKSINNPSNSTIISVINVSSILAALLGIALK